MSDPNSNIYTVPVVDTYQKVAGQESPTEVQVYWDSTQVAEYVAEHGGSPTLPERQIAFGSAEDAITGSDNFLWDNTTSQMTITNAYSMYMSEIGEYPIQVAAPLVGDKYTQLGMSGNTLYLANSGVVLSSSAGDINLVPDGNATVNGSRILTVDSNFQSGISDPMSGGLVEVTCADATTASIIGFSPVYNAAFATGVGGFMVRPLSGKFRIYYMNGDGAADGLTFMWYLIKP